MWLIAMVHQRSIEASSKVGSKGRMVSRRRAGMVWPDTGDTGAVTSRVTTTSPRGTPHRSLRTTSRKARQPGVQGAVKALVGLRAGERIEESRIDSTVAGVEEHQQPLWRVTRGAVVIESA